MHHRKMFQQFLALIHDLDEGDTKIAFEKLQRSLEYCLAENEVLQEGEEADRGLGSVRVAVVGEGGRGELEIGCELPY